MNRGLKIIIIMLIFPFYAFVLSLMIILGYFDLSTDLWDWLLKKLKLK